MDRPSRSACHHGAVSEDDPGNDSFEARVRWIAREVSRSVERLGELDIDEIARGIGVDADRARQLVNGAGQWLNAQAENFGNDAERSGARFGDAGPERDPRPSAGPHPLDLPTAEQGLALSALDSGRWTVEPGSNVLVADTEGPAPSDALGLAGELRARDWINADGEVTLVGHDALRRWVADASHE